MEQRIKNRLLALRIDFAAIWLTAAILAFAGESDVFVEYMFEPQSSQEFYFNVVCILMTVIGLPLGMKLFQLNTTKSLRRMNKDEALNFYFLWSIIRYVFFASNITFCIMAYYLTMNTTGALCAGMGMLLSLYCWPSRKGLDNYLDSINNGVE